MRFAEVRPSFGGFTVIALCLRCEKRIDGRKEKVFADLDGEAFKAYYCEKCKETEET